MMKRVKISFCFLVFYFLFLPPGHAQGPLAKFDRGLTNILTGPGEYLLQFYESSEKYSPVEAAFRTVFKGTFLTVLRELAGVYDVVTFPFPLPAGYEPIMRPPTVFEGHKQLTSSSY